VTGNRNAFWETKPHDALSAEEWEALCDGCGRCCLEKLEDGKTGKVYYTLVTCRLLDLSTCRCKAYADRARLMPGCLPLTPQRLFRKWLPSTCAYRLLKEGKTLPDWHPLVSGDPDSVHAAGISVRNFAVSGEGVDSDQLEHFIIGDGKL
jgi:uncharacterized cysteine cluster protein YcgN (CxxCxxCC family)